MFNVMLVDASRKHYQIEIEGQSEICQNRTNT